MYLLWSPKGEPVTVPYRTRRKRIIASGAISADGRRFFRTYEQRFAKEHFLSYLKELQHNFGRVHVIMDSSSVHTAKIIQEHVRKSKDIRVTYLPAATPELSAMEEYWHQSKHDVLVSEYYATVGAMRQTLSEYLRTHCTKLDVIKYVKRDPKTFKNL